MVSPGETRVYSLSKSEITAMDAAFKLQRMNMAPSAPWSRISTMPITSVPAAESKRDYSLGGLFTDDRSFIRREIVFSWGALIHIEITVERIQPQEIWGRAFATPHDIVTLRNALEWRVVKISIVHHPTAPNIVITFDGETNCQAILGLADGKPFFDFKHAGPEDKDIGTAE